MVRIAQTVTSSFGFRALVVAAILLSALIVGLETYPQLLADYGAQFKLIDRLIVAIFTIEIIFKMAALSPKPLNFFKDPWNVFDFAIVLLCYIPADVHFVGMLRIIRLLRVLRLISVLPKLQLLVNTLIKSIPSISYVILLLSLLFYVYAVIGSLLFGKNDPLHFGNLHVSMLTLFSVVTLEGWFDILKINMYGCQAFGYESQPALCNSPDPQPLASVIYFISFILLGAMIFINLFIGVVMNSMAESEKEMNAARMKAGGDVPANQLKRIETGLEDLKQDLAGIISQLKDKQGNNTRT